MSNIPTPKAIPPTTQQVNATLRSVIAASQTLINEDPRHFAELRATFLQFYSHPTFQLLLGLPSQQTPTQPPLDNQLKAELTEIKSTISALSKAVNGQQPKAKGTQAPTTHPPPPKGKPSAQGQGPGHVPNPTFASKAAVKPRPSLVLDLEVPYPKEQLTSELVTLVNDKLHAQGHQHVKLSAAKWTGKGNLVLTAHHTVTPAQLTDTSPIITSLLREAYPEYFKPTQTALTARANVKWSKILINSVPTGKCDTRGPWTPDECHRALTAHNPIYDTLKITQKPSWVRKPSSYVNGDSSSLVVAFEDPTGSHRRTLLSSRQLFLLGVRAKVSSWKDTPRPPPKTTAPNAPDSCTDSDADTRPASPVTSQDLLATIDHLRAPTSSARLPQKNATTPKPQRTTRSRKNKG